MLMPNELGWSFKLQPGTIYYVLRRKKPYITFINKDFDSLLIYGTWVRRLKTYTDSHYKRTMSIDVYVLPMSHSTIYYYTIVIHSLICSRRHTMYPCH